MRVIGDERGLGWFAAAGFLIFIIALALTGQAARLGTRADLGASPRIDPSLAAVANLQDDLRHAARLAVYEALWQVGWRASGFRDDISRTLELERLASERFRDYLTALGHAGGGMAGLQLGQGKPAVKIRSAEGGFVLARIELPKGTRIAASAPDNSVQLALAYENFEVFVDSRYFLLQERMRTFASGFEGIRSSWQWAEYAAAWVQVPSGKVSLSERLSQELLKLAWAGHEYQTFGSVDYPDVGLELGGLLDSGLSAALQNIESELRKTKERIELERDNFENMGVERSLLEDALGAIENGLHKLPGALTGAEMGSLLDILPKSAGSIHPNLTRAQLYTIAPPRPINPEPGLSVLRELEIERVSYKRRDPAGWFGPFATPIYIPIINVTIWFAEVEVSIEFKRKPVEQIYDFNHQTLPRPLLENGAGLVKVHKALTYRYELPVERMSFSLYLVWPWAFSVEVS